MVKLFGIDFKVVMLSFFIKGLVKGDMVIKVVEVIKLVKEVNLDFVIDGEL